MGDGQRATPAPDGDTWPSWCDVCGAEASHEYTPPLYDGRLLLCNGCNPTHNPMTGDEEPNW